MSPFPPSILVRPANMSVHRYHDMDLVITDSDRRKCRHIVPKLLVLELGRTGTDCVNPESALDHYLHQRVDSRISDVKVVRIESEDCVHPFPGPMVDEDGPALKDARSLFSAGVLKTLVSFLRGQSHAEQPTCFQ